MPSALGFRCGKPTRRSGARATELDSFTTPYTDTIAGHDLIRGPPLSLCAPQGAATINCRIIIMSCAACPLSRPNRQSSLSTDPREFSLECEI